MDMAELAEVFGSEKNYGVRDHEDGPAVFPDGSTWAKCTNWARYVRRVLGERVAIYGFSEDDNPTSEIARICGGHDFAVVDNRYVVDGWAMNVERLSTRAVFDLSDPADAEEIRRLYGSRECWQRGSGLEQELDEETPSARDAALAGTGFADIATPALSGPCP